MEVLKANLWLLRASEGWPAMSSLPCPDARNYVEDFGRFGLDVARDISSGLLAMLQADPGKREKITNVNLIVGKLQ